MVIEIPVFIDTSVLVAYANEKDQNHERAKKIVSEVLSEKYDYTVISDSIFSETVTVCLARTKSIEKAKELGKYLLHSEIILVRIDEMLFGKAWQIFCTNKSRLSFVDASSIALIKYLGASHIATFDENLGKESEVEVLS